MNFKENIIAIIIEARERVKSIFKSYKLSDANNRHILNELKEKGYYVLESYYSEEICQKIIKKIDSTLLIQKMDTWVDSVGSDHRIYGANKVCVDINRFYSDDFINDVLQSYEGFPYKDGFTLAAKLVAVEQNIGSGGGWHRDSSATKQTKAIVYLTDTFKANGPFQYIRGSHKFVDLIRLAFSNGFSLLKTRFTDYEVQNILDAKKEKPITFIAKRGTVILVDTRGLHRGSPIEEGVRYALTNYNFVGKKVPDHLRELFIKAPSVH